MEKNHFLRVRMGANARILSRVESPTSQFRSRVRSRRRQAMVSHGSRILAVTAALMLSVSVHSVRAADFAGSVQGVVKSASGQALSGAYVKLFNAERRLTFMVVS